MLDVVMLAIGVGSSRKAVSRRSFTAICVMLLAETHKNTARCTLSR
jgi:hypothetical protein